MTRHHNAVPLAFVVAALCALGGRSLAVDKPNFVVILGEGAGWTSSSVPMDDRNPASKGIDIKTPNLAASPPPACGSPMATQLHRAARRRARHFSPDEVRRRCT